MKTKKYLFLMLAAALFAACSNDDEDGSTPPTGPEQPSVIDFADYSSAIDQPYVNILRQYGEPTMAFGEFYVYENMNDGKVSTLSLIANPSNQQIYMIMELLAKDAYKAEDIADYFASKYTTYSKEAVDVWDEDYENVIGSTYAYTFGNADKEEDATLIIEVNGNQSVSYTNPKNMPTENSGSNSLDDMTPNDAVLSFLLWDVEDIEAEYPDVFEKNPNGMYMVFMEENPYLMGIAFTPVDGFVTTLILLYNEELTDEDIIAYYEELGYTATKTGVDEEGEDIYTITNGAILISYSACRAEITFVDED